MAQPKAEITVVPADENDSLVLAQIESMAFDGPSPYALSRTNTPGLNETKSGKGQEQPLSQGRLMFGVPSAEGYAIRARAINERLKTNPDYHIYKAILKENGGTEKIVGFAAWRFCADAPFPVEDTWKDLPWEGCANPTACNDFFGGLARLRTKYLGGKKVALLETLTIDPSAQGLGIGSKMLDEGLEEARKLGLTESWLEASDAGHGLYWKYGWRDVEVFTTDFAKYGAEGSAKVTVMKRECA
ncbi:hypothetical protein TMatcc_005838 [Talaromyces marneffei ATCC 18224]|uniref:N-acetyltransferase domain-containing protein n=1 Tax=Talaromyces marneffei (strain ATCC 18224 / CBS 334.59 / QM 7333) TaxID=441960 RepID=B6Q8W0_TALMQ|nr:conserved hypothetical protein [Talaromyces marneffei ATCC 18224]KAE8554604.1 hypothetical protein EYB25_003145 [Talaromyces marneffei]